MKASLAALERHLRELGRVAVAVSGGVDSLTLAVIAHRVRPDESEIFHAISPAVPPEATERVQRYARREGWTLQVVDAGEFADDNYVANPVNRCYFCKTHLYGAIVARTSATVLSGTNTGDLGDYRPGLVAARESGVVHPYVTTGIDKRTVREIARELGLTDVAELPAAPCLSSRVETGILIAPETLTKVHRVEREVTALLEPRTVRCRVRHDGVTVELDESTLEALSPELRERVRDRAGSLWPEKAVHLAPYRRGSSFLR